MSARAAERALNADIEHSTVPSEVAASAGGLIERNRAEIMSLWEQCVRAERQSIRRQSRLALQDGLPDLLQSMATALSGPAPAAPLSERAKSVSEEHGEQRAAIASYSLEQAIFEYHVLERTVVLVLEHHGCHLDGGARDTISEVLFLSMMTAAATFQGVRDQKTRASQLALEDALDDKASEARLKDQLITTIKERVMDYAILSLDATGHITSWSKGAERIAQYAAEEILGRDLALLYPEDGRRRRDPDHHLRVAREEGRFRGQSPRVRKDGESFTADVSIVPMVEAGLVVGYFMLITDLTEESRVLQERDLSRAEVETLQTERELRERFVSTLTHDLRTPLGVAILGAHLIVGEPCSVPLHAELARRSHRSLRRMDRMITDLLDANRVTAGESLPLAVEPCDLSRLIAELREELAAVAGERIVMRAPQSLEGYWDPQGLRRAIENLVMNGLKYGERATPVTTRARRLHDRVLIEVHNFGRPIPADEQDSLFAVFRRSRTVDETRTKGWGLGLTIVRGITIAHGGAVKVSSLPNRGTTFTLDLPLDARGSAVMARARPPTDRRTI